MAVKKVAKKSAKKAAETKGESKTPTISKGFNLFEKTGLVAGIQESMMKLRVRATNKPVTLKSLSQVERNYLELDSLGMQILFGGPGISTPSVLEIMGEPGTGKSTLVTNLAGQALLRNSPVYIINTEAKWLTEDRVLRALHTNPQMAAKMADLITVDSEVTEITQMIETIEQWVMTLREIGPVIVPKRIPLMVIVDTLSKVMGSREAAGIVNYGKSEKKFASEKMEELANPFSHYEFAKVMQAWSRRWPTWMTQNNVILVLVSHQNQKIEMSTNPMVANLPESYKTLTNTTSKGGAAVSQNTYLRLIMRAAGYERVQGAVGGHSKIIEGRVHKNTTAAEDHRLKWTLRLRQYEDIEGEYQTSAIEFHKGAAEYLAKESTLGVTVTNGNYTCKTLDLKGLPSDEFIKAIEEDPEKRRRVLLSVGIRSGIDAGPVEVKEPVCEDTKEE